MCVCVCAEACINAGNKQSSCIPACACACGTFASSVAATAGNYLYLQVFFYACICSVFDHKIRAALRPFPICCSVCCSFSYYCLIVVLLLLLLLLHCSPVDSRLLCSSQLSQKLPLRQLSASCIYVFVCNADSCMHPLTLPSAHHAAAQSCLLCSSLQHSDAYQPLLSLQFQFKMSITSFSPTLTGLLAA